MPPVNHTDANNALPRPQHPYRQTMQVSNGKVAQSNRDST